MSLSHYLFLSEAREFAILLNENQRAEFVRKKYGEAAGKVFEASKATQPANILQDVAAQQGDDDITKVLNYIFSHDPTANKQFSQWMVVMFIKGQLPLEDLERVSRYLEVFNRAKARIAQRDINQYKTVPDLYAAVQPFIDGQQAVSLSAERDEIAIAMAKQSKIVLDNAKWKIVIPKTQEAAAYFGKNTEWCTSATTSTNYFDSYNAEGPLYIILDKPTNRRWQLHINQRGVEFRDEQDRSVNVENFLTENPEIFHAIGEKNFVNAVASGTIGTSLFSPEGRELIGDSVLCKATKTMKELLEINPKAFTVESNVYAIFRNVPYDGVNTPDVLSFEKIMKYFMSIKEIIPIVLEAIKSFSPAIPFVPKKYRTDEFILAVTQPMRYQTMATNIPKPWSPVVKHRFWELRIRTNRAAIDLDKVPKDLLNDNLIADAISQSASRNGSAKEKIEKYSHFLNQKVVELLAYGLSPQYTLPFLPEEWKNNETVASIISAVKQQGNNNGAERTKETLLKILLDFPKDTWRPESVLDIIKASYAYRYDGKEKKIQFNDLPENMRTKEVAEYYVGRTDLNAVPAHYLTQAFVSQYISTHFANIAKTPKEFLIPAIINPAYQLVKDNNEDDAMDGGYYSMRFLDELSVKYLTPEIIEDAVSRGWLKLTKIPASLLTKENILRRAMIKRIYNFEKEMSAIPDVFFTEEFATDLVEANADAIEGIPKAKRTEPVLYAWLKQQQYEKENRHHSRDEETYLTDAPHSQLSPRIVSMAIDKDYLSPKYANLPSQHVDKQTAKAILAKSEDQLSAIPIDMIDDDDLVDIVEKNIRIISVIEPERMNSKFADVAMKNWAAKCLDTHWATKITYIDKEKPEYKLLSKIPRDLYTLKTWAYAAGCFIPLGKVPSRYRLEPVLLRAVLLNPASVAAIPNNANWLNDHLSDLPDTKDKNAFEKWIASLESVGVSKIGRKYVSNQEEATEVELSKGFRGAYTDNRGKIKAWLYNKKKDVVGTIAVDKHHDIVLSDKEAMQPYREQVVELVNKLFANRESSPMLNRWGYYQSGAGFKTISDFPKTPFGGSDILWSAVPSSSEEIFVCYKGSSEKLRFTKNETQSSGWNRGGSEYIGVVKVTDINFCLQNADKIAAYVKAKVGSSCDVDRLKKIGIVKIPTDRYTTTFKTLAAKKVLSDDLNYMVDGKKTFQVWTNDVGNELYGFAANGRVAFAKIKKDGTLAQNISFDNIYDFKKVSGEYLDSTQAVEDNIKEILVKAAAQLASGKPK